RTARDAQLELSGTRRVDRRRNFERPRHNKRAVIGNVRNRVVDAVQRPSPARIDCEILEISKRTTAADSTNGSDATGEFERSLAACNHSVEHGPWVDDHLVRRTAV